MPGRLPLAIDGISSIAAMYKCESRPASDPPLPHRRTSEARPCLPPGSGASTATWPPAVPRLAGWARILASARLQQGDVAPRQEIDHAPIDTATAQTAYPCPARSPGFPCRRTREHHTGHDEAHSIRMLIDTMACISVGGGGAASTKGRTDREAARADSPGTSQPRLSRNRQRRRSAIPLLRGDADGEG